MKKRIINKYKKISGRIKKRMIPKIKEDIKKGKYYYIILLTFFVFIDFLNKYLVLRTFNVNDYINIESFIFSVFWIIILVTISYMIKGLSKKIYTLFLTILFSIFSIINYFMISYFGNAFSWKDLVLSGEGLNFMDSIFKFVNIKFIILLLICISFIIILVYLSKHDVKYRLKSYKTIIIIFIFILLCGLYNYNNKRLSNTTGGWDSNEILNNNSNLYTNWISPNKLILIGGTYDYVFRDFYNTFIKSENINKSYKIVEKYISDNNLNKDIIDNETIGIFKDKNLIFVMLESMDDWMISKDVTPTIWEMMHHGYNFNEHYSPVYVTGSTANTEFIANTGIYPNINYLLPNYAYNTNAYDYSLPSVFKSNGYTVNSFHRSNAHIYNREQMHKSFGYEEYNNYAKMGIPEKYIDLDSYIAKNAYNKIVSSKKFMSFIITYSPHTPYNYSKIECKENLKNIEKLNLDLNEEQICALSSARETDNMFKILLKKLKKDKILDNTVIVGFTDHPNKVVIKEDETDKLNKTIFFIYNNKLKDNQIWTVSSTIDIVPTIQNLFGLKNDYLYPGNDLLAIDNNSVIFNDYTYYNGKEILPIEQKHINDLDYSKNLLISDYYKKRRFKND